MPFLHWALFQKKKTEGGRGGRGGRGGWEHTFLETPPGISRFFILPLESPDKIKFLETAQNCYNPWKFQDLKPRTPGNSTWFFLDHPWKSQPLEIPLTISSIYTPGNSISSNPLSPCCFFFWNSPLYFKFEGYTAARSFTSSCFY